MAAILNLHIDDTGKLIGRVLTEAMPNGRMPQWKTSLQESQPNAAGQQTIVQIQHVGETRYFDAAGYAGRTVGLSMPKSKE
jgi:hypothetical protein